MTPHPSYRAFSGVLLAGAVVLVACASTPTRFFTLDPVAPAQSAPTPSAPGASGPAVKLLAVHIPPELDREELVDETSPGEVHVHDFEHWSAPLGQTARQVLIQDLAARLPAGQALSPSAPSGDGAALLSVDVLSFHAGPQGAVMQAAWSATLPGAAAAAAAPVTIRSPLRQLQSPGVPADGAGTAQAFSALLGQLADQIAATLPEEAQAALTRQAEIQAQAAAAAAAALPHARTTTRTRTTTSQSSSGQPS